MKALTVRNLPDAVADAIQKRSEEAHLSFSKALISLLGEHVGMGAKRKKRQRDLRYLTGVWNEREYLAFQKALTDQRKIDPEMWK